MSSKEKAARAREQRPAAKGGAPLPPEVDEALLQKAAKELEASGFATPFSLSKKLEVKVSLAKKILRILAERGAAKLYSGGKRCPIYVAVKRPTKAK